MYIIIIFIIFFSIILLILIKKSYRDEFTSLGGTNPLNLSPGVIRQVSSGNWQFIPTTGYYGTAELTYLLSDGSGNPPVTSYATINVKRVFQPITANNPTIGPQIFPVTNSAGISSIPSYQFTGDQLIQMLGVNGGEWNSSVNNLGIVFTSLVQTPANSPISIPVSLQVNGINIQAVPLSSLKTASGISTNSLPSNTLFTYLPPSGNLPTNVNLTFYLIDLANYSLTLSPGGVIEGPSGPFTLSFQLPQVYNRPVPIPVVITSVVTDGQITIGEQQLINGVTPIPGFNYTLSPINVSLISCSPGSQMNSSGACNPCPANQSSINGATCTNCAAGYTSISGGVCVQCPVGMTSVSGGPCTSQFYLFDSPTSSYMGINTSNRNGSLVGVPVSGAAEGSLSLFSYTANVGSTGGNLEISGGYCLPNVTNGNISCIFPNPVANGGFVMNGTSNILSYNNLSCGNVSGKGLACTGVNPSVVTLTM